jgi:hypothetical protein
MTEFYNYFFNGKSARFFCHHESCKRENKYADFDRVIQAMFIRKTLKKHKKQIYTPHDGDLKNLYDEIYNRESP